MYGGHEGISFILKGRFDSIADMVEAFQRGNEYQDVWYHEFCLIDTPNKNDADNGKIYQRGLDYSNDMGGAIYKGQIVGPASGTPLFQLNTIKEVTDKSTMALEENDYRKYPIAYDTDDEGHVIGYEYNTDANEPIAVFPFSKAHDMSLVPGKKEDGTFNDEIRWTWCNIRKSNKEDDSWFYVGFEIPYLVVDYKAHPVSQYDEFGNIITNALTIDRVDDGTHPFYGMWDVGVPKGVKGDTIRNLRVITPTELNRNQIYSASAIQINPTTGEMTMGAAGYPGIDDDIAAEREILVYDIYSYDKKLNPDPYMIYVGDFNNIESISVADDGTLTISYTHDDNTVFTRKIKWIKEATLSSDTGVFTVTYNNGDPAFTTTLDWIKDIELEEDGTIHFYHTKDAYDEVYNHRLKWVTSVELNPTTGLFTMNFNYGDALTRQLNWVDDIYINEDTGEIVIHHVDSSVGDDGEVTLPAKLKLITSVDVSTDGYMTFHTNTGESFQALQSGTDTPFRLKYVENVTLNSGINDDKRIQIKYNTNPTNTPIGDPINFVEDMIVRENDYHLLVLFNDPTHRATAGDLDGEGYDEEGNRWVTGVTASDGTVSSAYWRDYGTIKDQSGILIGLNLTAADTGGTDIIDYLNITYPNGLTEGSVKQKIVTYAPGVNDEKDFYAFDYNTYQWYYLGKISASGLTDAMLVTQGQFNNETLANVATGGLVFKIINTSGLKTTAIPKFWDKAYTSWQ